MKTKTEKQKSSLIIACGLALVVLPAALGNEKDAADKFKAMDTDGDGRISRTEHAAGAKGMFEKMDSNQDGMVTAGEMNAANLMKEERAGSATAEAKPTAAEKIKAIDLDGDGQLTAAEHAAGSDSMFTRMDTDGDGFLGQAELAAGHKLLKKDN